MSSKYLVLGVVVTLCVSCAVSREPGNDKLDVQAQQRLNRSQTSTFFKWDDHAVSYKACQEQRGEVRRVCMFGQPMCVMPGSVPSFVEKEKRRNLLLTKQIAQRGEGGLRREEGYHD